MSNSVVSSKCRMVSFSGICLKGAFPIAIAGSRLRVDIVYASCTGHTWTVRCLAASPRRVERSVERPLHISDGTMVKSLYSLFFS